MADLLFDYRIQKTAEIFEEDSSFKKILAKYGIYIPDIFIDERNPDRIKLYEELSSLLLADYDFISNRTIDNLWFLKFGVNRINQIFDKVDIVDYNLYKQIMFTFKYSTIKHFFQDNFAKFLPSPDAAAITGNEKMELFQIAFMKEYDRFADIINSVYDIVDVDKIDNQYLAYLIQLLGYEKGDDGGLLGNDSFRQLAKNIIEVYKMKGSNYSFELFFNFLGFEIDLKEFWFDKRFSDENISVNPFTNSTNPAYFSFYLTPIKPTMYIPEGMIKPYQVMENELTDIRSHLWFEKKLYEGAPIEKLLNNNPEDPPEEGFDFTFFKTNVIQYSVRRIRSKETDSDELSPEDEKIINAYADFLTPIFIMKQVAISISPFEDVAEGLYLTDASYWDRKLRTVMNMYKQHAVKFLLDDWVNDPLEPWNATSRAPLVMLEQTDVNTPSSGSEDRGRDREEPHEVYLLINSTFDGTNVFFTNDFMTEIGDDDNMQKTFEGKELEFASNKMFKIHVLTSEQINYLSEDDKLRSIWDVVLIDEENKFNTLNHLAGYGDEEEGLEKIVNYFEEMFNRIHRLENLNIFSRDYQDWDNFSEIRIIPNLSDGSDILLSMNEFDEIEDGGSTIYNHTDGGASDTPWLYHEELRIVVT